MLYLSQSLFFHPDRYFFFQFYVSLTFELFFVSLSVFLPADGETHRIIYDAGVCTVHALHSSSVSNPRENVDNRERKSKRKRPQERLSPSWLVEIVYNT
jgi:hypothetical protein